MTPHYDGQGVTLWHGDCLDVLATLPDCSVDAVVTDPPYGLEFMGKDWDKFARQDTTAIRSNAGGFADDEGKPWNKARGGTKGVRSTFRCRTCQGWSGTFSEARARRQKSCECETPDYDYAGAPAQTVAFGKWCEQWAAECLRVLKPGGHLLAFGGSRTYHRLTSGVEDSGFEIRDCITWHFATGFPKSLDVSKAIDKRPGVVHHRQFAAELKRARERAGLSTMDVSEAVMETSSGACWNWENHQFPSAAVWPRLRDLLGMDGEKWDPIFAEAERPKVGEVTHARSGGEDWAKRPGSVAMPRTVDVTANATDAARQWQGWGTALKPATEFIVVARKPLAGTVAANVQAWGTGALNIDDCRIEGGARPLIISKSEASMGILGDGLNGSSHGGSTTAGRWPANVIFDETQAARLDEQSGDLHSQRPTNPSLMKTSHFGGGQATERQNHYDDSGVSLGASRFFFVAKADAGERPRANGTAHPTVKPLALMRHLVRLVTPPGGTVLEPFAGSGTTVEACLLEGFRCIAIEKTDEYLPLILARIHRQRDPVEAIRLAGDDLGLFDLDGFSA